ncbi:glutathione S-transferase [Marivivens aquimaris]|uniref:glutathione S-transferase n=1 Tax=Marivivens aquimaris TaxID=2774876 RepID=UPI0018826C65|nr:glutathione S-transferase [Marivivens aquimaris]
MTDTLPILWSFRRCPYAMRARLAVLSSGVQVELREILLRDKPEAFRATSPSATVPCMKDGDQVHDESFDIMIHVLRQSDPEGLLDMPDDGWELIRTNDGPFKDALNHTKYAVRYPDLDPIAERHKAVQHLMGVNDMLGDQLWLYGERPTIADLATLPFVRQFANIDRDWFDAQDWPALKAWLVRFTGSDRFAAIMPKFTPWKEGDAPVLFG